MFLPGREIGWKRFGTALKKEWKRDRLTNTGGALTFQGLLALFPFILFCVTLAGLVIKPEQMDALIQQLAQVAPRDAVRILGDEIRDIHKNQSVGLLTVGIVGAIWSASGGVTSLMDALNGVYAVEEGRPFWKVRLIALGITLGGGLAILIAALAAVVAGPIADHLPQPFSTIVTLSRLPVAAVVMMLAWACLYYFLPDVEQKFKFITPGSVLGVMIWLAASWGFSFYASHFGSYQKTYGAIGGVVVMLMWMWISSVVLLLGAVVNATIEQLSPEGKRVGAKSGEDTGGGKTKSEAQDAGEIPGGKQPAPAYVAVPAVQIVRPPTPANAMQRVPAKPKISKALLGLGLLFLFGKRHRTA